MEVTCRKRRGFFACWLLARLQLLPNPLTARCLVRYVMLVSPDLNQILPQSVPFDPCQKPYSNWDVIKTRDNGGMAFYNGLETVISHRYSSGIFFQSSWIWSKNLSDAEGDIPNVGFPAENGPRVNHRYDLHANYGNVAYTRRHRW